MIPIAENQIDINQQFFIEGQTALRSRRCKKYLARLGFGLAVICLLSAVWLLYTGASLIGILIEAIFMCALLLWLSFVFPKAGSKGKFKAMAASGESMSRKTVFYNNYLTVCSGKGKETVILYSDVQELLETKHLWIIRCRDGRGILMKKDGFTVGSIDSIRPIVFRPKTAA